MGKQGFLLIGSEAEFPPGSRRLVQVGPDPVLVLRQPDGWVAFVDYCPHRAGPLSEGTFTHDTVTCPWHAACFDLKSGKTLSGPGGRGLKTREVQVDATGVWVAEAPQSL
ncbi:Rieske (2Fe-2S) protein [bacterium]|nr:Rieske (2Fe-2S) protein [bacterium]